MKDVWLVIVKREDGWNCIMARKTRPAALRGTRLIWCKGTPRREHWNWMGFVCHFEIRFHWLIHEVLEDPSLQTWRCWLICGWFPTNALFELHCVMGKTCSPTQTDSCLGDGIFLSCCPGDGNGSGFAQQRQNEGTCYRDQSTSDQGEHTLSVVHMHLCVAYTSVLSIEFFVMDQFVVN